mmetsp:Transcript_12533/g.30406  ORF Transcript_12533/g.30406 Transcript_12533/m.30406 type:complete len:333 (+) Transcript_12533:612-1610(+)
MIVWEDDAAIAGTGSQASGLALMFRAACSPPPVARAHPRLSSDRHPRAASAVPGEGCRPRQPPRARPEMEMPLKILRRVRTPPRRRHRRRTARDPPRNPHRSPFPTRRRSYLCPDQDPSRRFLSPFQRPPSPTRRPPYLTRQRLEVRRQTPQSYLRNFPQRGGRSHGRRRWGGCLRGCPAARRWGGCPHEFPGRRGRRNGAGWAAGCTARGSQCVSRRRRWWWQTAPICAGARCCSGSRARAGSQRARSRRHDRVRHDATTRRILRYCRRRRRSRCRSPRRRSVSPRRRCSRLRRRLCLRRPLARRTCEDARGNLRIIHRRRTHFRLGLEKL